MYAEFHDVEAVHEHFDLLPLQEPNFSSGYIDTIPPYFQSSVVFTAVGVALGAPVSETALKLVHGVSWSGRGAHPWCIAIDCWGCSIRPGWLRAECEYLQNQGVDHPRTAANSVPASATMPGQTMEWLGFSRHLCGGSEAIVLGAIRFWCSSRMQAETVVILSRGLNLVCFSNRRLKVRQPLSTISRRTRSSRPAPFESQIPRS